MPPARSAASGSSSSTARPSGRVAPRGPQPVELAERAQHLDLDAGARVVLPDDLGALEADAPAGREQRTGRPPLAVALEGQPQRRQPGDRELTARGDVLERRDDGAELRLAGTCQAPDRPAGVVERGEALGVGRLVDRARRVERLELDRRPWRSAWRAAGRRGARRRAALRVRGRGRRGTWSGRRERMRVPCTRRPCPGRARAQPGRTRPERLHRTATSAQHVIRGNAIGPMLGSPRRASPPATHRAPDARALGRSPVMQNLSESSCCCASAPRSPDAAATTSEAADDSTDVERAARADVLGRAQGGSGSCDLVAADRRAGRDLVAAPGAGRAQAERPVRDAGRGQAAAVRHGRLLRGRRPELQGRRRLDRRQGLRELPGHRVRGVRPGLPAVQGRLRAGAEAGHRPEQGPAVARPRSASTRAAG